MKTCTRCGEEKPMVEFCKSKTSKDGRQYWCRSCNAEHKTAWNLANRAKRREDNRKYYQENKQYFQQWGIEYRAMNKKVKRAHRMTATAIKDGTLVPQRCEQCFCFDSIQAHHEDYDKPLDVRWLCDSCHKQLHGEIKRAANIQQEESHVQ